jgi:two-component system sensor histidine kinase/response regulator
MLERLGHRVDTAANGLEAVSAVTSVPYDLVLMDLMMPDMDGLAATRRIRALPGAESAVPVVGLTASALQADRDACMEAGMDGLATKPVTRDRLAAAIDAAIAGRAAETPAAAAHHGPAGDAMPTARLRDLEATLGTEITTEIIGLFMQTAPSQLTAIEDAVSARDFVQSRRAAHALVGAAANIGLDVLAPAAKEIELNSGTIPQDDLMTAMAALAGEMADSVRRLESVTASAQRARLVPAGETAG